MNAVPAAFATESFLQRFHDASPGGSPLAFASRAVVDERGIAYPDTYAALLEAAQGDTDHSLRVLDLACGDGHLLSRSAARHQHFGVDFSRAELACARRALAPDIALLLARAQQLPIQDGCMDVVMSHMALMLMEEPTTVLAEVRRVLQPQGRLLAVVGAAPACGTKPDTGATNALLGSWRRLLRDAGYPAAANTHFSHASTWRSHDSLLALLSPFFEDVELRRLNGVIRGTPEFIWQWFSGTYDLALVSADQHATIRQGLVDAAASLVDANGWVPLETCYWLIKAHREAHRATPSAASPIRSGPHP